jgi:hypothetical protein
MNRIVFAALLAMLAAPCFSQSIGGNASLTAGVTTSSVALPASVRAYPALLIQPATGASVEAFWAIGVGSATATLTSAAVPSNGICIIVGPNNYFAGITASATSIIRLTQLTTCPPR